MSASDLKYNNTSSTSLTYGRSKPVRFQSLKLQKALHSLNTPSCHMHQYTHQHAFTPVLHQSSVGFPTPAMTGAQHSNFIQDLPNGTTRRPSFTPLTAFHKVTQKSFKSAKRGRWGALHACIAWQIYYHKQLKKMQPKPNSPHQELTSSRPDSVQHQEPAPGICSCIQPYLDSTCGQSAYGERSEIGKTTENRSHLKKRHPSDHYTSYTASSHLRTTKKELGQLNWKVKTNEKLDACSNVLPLKGKPLDHTVVTPELDSRRDTVSRGRKRTLGCDSFINVKRVKQEVEDDQFDPSLSTTRTDPLSRTTPVQHINTSDTSALYCYSSGCNVVSYPGAEMYPYPTASWEYMLNQFKRMNYSLTQQFLGDYLQNGYEVIKIPRAMRQQETAHLSRRKFMNLGIESHHLHHRCHSATTSHLLHPGFLAASYTGL